MSNPVESLRAYFKNDRFATENGMEIVEVRPGHSRARMTVESRHLNSVGTLHGGAVSTLADLAFAAACNAAGEVAVGVNMSITCLKAVRSGTLEAEAVEISRSRKLSTVTVRVTDEQQELVALFQGTAYILGKNHPFPPTAS